MHQVSIICQCEVRSSGCALRTLELERSGVDQAVVVQTIEEGVAIHVVNALRVAATDSILADGIFNDRTVRFTHGSHREGAWRDLA